MADIIATNLAGKKVTETYKGVLHFDSALGTTKKPVYDGAGTQTALSLGPNSDGIIVQGDLQVLNDIVVSSDSTLVGNVSVGGNLNLTNGGNINDLTIGEIGNDISLKSSKTIETSKLRIRESSTDYELIFGDPTQSVANLFSIIVKKDNNNNLYIKNNYTDPDITAPLWIDRSTGRVTIKSLVVNSFDYAGSKADSGLFPSGGIMSYPSATIPNGWLECDGRELSINDYGILYKIIGQNYKTNNSLDTNSKFQIPDMRSLYIRGWDHGKGVDLNRALGTTQDVTLSSGSGSSNIALVYCIKT